MIKEMLIVLIYFGLIVLMVWSNLLVVIAENLNNNFKIGYTLLSSTATLGATFCLFTQV